MTLKRYTEKDLDLAESAYSERFLIALRSCTRGTWGLFGMNESLGEDASGAIDLLTRGAAIAEMRETLGYTEPFLLHAKFLAYRKAAKDPNAPGEPKLAAQLLREIG